MITDHEEYLILFAKDRLVQHYGSSLLHWSLEQWLSALMQFIDNLSDRDLERIELIYGE